MLRNPRLFYQTTDPSSPALHEEKLFQTWALKSIRVQVRKNAESNAATLVGSALGFSQRMNEEISVWAIILDIKVCSLFCNGRVYHSMSENLNTVKNDIK
jgi:hypothetical protein